jgi:hypothetical protein
MQCKHARSLSVPSDWMVELFHAIQSDDEGRDLVFCTAIFSM